MRRTVIGICIGVCTAALAATLAGGCSLEPQEAAAHRKALESAGRPYVAPFESRRLPEIPASATWQQVLERTLLASGELEAAYFDWKAAVAAARAAGEYPGTNVMFGYGYLFSGGNTKSWDRTTLQVSGAPSMNIQLPAKTAAAAKAAFENAQAKARRFEAAKFELQRKTLTTYFDFVLTSEKLRIQEETTQLLKTLADITEQRVRAGAAQAFLLRAQTEYELAVNEQANLGVELATRRAELNGMMLRAADAPLSPPAELPTARALPASDLDLAALAIRNNPDLAALAKELAASRADLELARLGWLPELNMSFAITGSVSQAIAGMIMFPTNWDKVQAGVDEAGALLAGVAARNRQARFDVGSRFQATLLALRNSERQAELFEKSVVPKARQTWDSATKSYMTGASTFADMLDAERALLAARLMAAEARMNREKKLADLEALMGADVETLAQRPASPAPSTRPTSAPATE